MEMSTKLPSSYKNTPSSFKKIVFLFGQENSKTNKKGLRLKETVPHSKTVPNQSVLSDSNSNSKQAAPNEEECEKVRGKSIKDRTQKNMAKSHVFGR